jgi:hypothetical protein
LYGPSLIPLSRNGAPRLALYEQIAILGSLDGMFSDFDRTTVVVGRRADPNRTNEIVMTANTAQMLGAHVGEVLSFGLYTPAEMAAPGYGTPTVAPRLLVRARLVGIVVVNTQVIEDDVDQSYGFVIVTPALIRETLAISLAATPPVLYGVQLDRVSIQSVSTLEAQLTSIVPRGSTYEFHQALRVVSEVELSVKPESIALGAFGAIAALVVMALAIQSISRQLRLNEVDRQILRALGADSVTAVAEGLIVVLAGVVVGSLLAGVVAVALSPLAPVGPVRPVYGDVGFAFDWTVLGVGAAALMGSLGTAAVVLAFRGAPHKVARTRESAVQASSVVRATEAIGLRVAGVVGVRFALEPGRGRTAVPVRSALVGSMLAVAVVVATLTFASGLKTLVSHPSLYGWNWNYMLNPSTDVPPHAVALLNHDPDVAAWAGEELANAQIDHQIVPILIGTPRAELSPPILSGHALDANNQIVLGAGTLALLHKHVGETVTASYGTPEDAPIYVPPTVLRNVGTATFPAVGYTSFIADHTSMGTGALVGTGIEPPAFQRALMNLDPVLNGPEMVFVRLRAGVSAKAGRADMQRIVAAADEEFAHDPQGKGNTVTVLGVQRPAQIVNYRTIGSTPIILAIGLALGAIVALGLTLGASVRRRRRDLALLKALGFVQRQLGEAVAWQASVAAIVGDIVGIPLGLFMGRELWTLFARNIDAVPDPTIPVLSVVLVGVGALVFANLVAALPGRLAGRTPTALLLRAE